MPNAPKSRSRSLVLLSQSQVPVPGLAARLRKTQSYAATMIHRKWLHGRSTPLAPSPSHLRRAKPKSTIPRGASRFYFCIHVSDSDTNLTQSGSEGSTNGNESRIAACLPDQLVPIRAHVPRYIPLLNITTLFHALALSLACSRTRL